jgi:hypothetical protein
MKRGAKKGFGMAVALITLFILSVIAFALGSIGIRNMAESTRARLDNAAFQASRAGLNYTWSYLNRLLDTWAGYGTCSPPYTVACLALVHYKDPVLGVQPCQGNKTGWGSFVSGTNNVPPVSDGSFSATYYSNLLDCNGYPASTWVSVSDPTFGTIYIPPGYVAVASVGNVGQSIFGGFGPSGVTRRTLGMLAWNNTYNFAMGDVSSFAVSGHLHTDSYNSAAGPYGGTNIGSDGNVGTNSTCPAPGNCTTSCGSGYAFCIGGSAQINGTVVVGIGGFVSGATASNPTGGWVQCNGCVNTTVPVMPSGIPLGNTCPSIYSCTTGKTSSGATYYNVTASNNSTCSPTSVLPPGAYGDLNVSGTAYLGPGTYSFSSILLNNNANLYACFDSTGQQFSANEPTIIYLSNQFTKNTFLTLSNNSNIMVVDASNPSPPSQDPPDTNHADHLIIYGNQYLTTITISPGGGNYTMGLYAPSATSSWGNGGGGTGHINIYGAMVIQTLPPNNNGTIYFHADEALRRVFSLGQPRLVRAFQADY